MKVLAFRTLLEQMRSDIYQQLSTLQLTLNQPTKDAAITPAIAGKFHKAINGLGGMINHMNKQLKIKHTVPVMSAKNLKDRKAGALGAPYSYNPNKSVQSIVSDVLGKMDATLSQTEKFMDKDHARDYQNLVNADNSKMKITKPFKDGQKEAVKELKSAITAVKKIEKAIAKAEA